MSATQQLPPAVVMTKYNSSYDKCGGVTYMVTTGCGHKYNARCWTKSFAKEGNKDCPLYKQAVFSETDERYVNPFVRSSPTSGAGSAIRVYTDASERRECVMAAVAQVQVVQQTPSPMRLPPAQQQQPMPALEPTYYSPELLESIYKFDRLRFDCQMCQQQATCIYNWLCAQFKDLPLEKWKPAWRVLMNVHKQLCEKVQLANVVSIVMLDKMSHFYTIDHAKHLVSSRMYLIEISVTWIHKYLIDMYVIATTRFAYYVVIPGRPVVGNEYNRF